MPAEVSVVVNNVLELQCEASGVPAPTFSWLKDGRPLPQTDSLLLLRGGEVLRVDSAQVSNQMISRVFSRCTYTVSGCFYAFTQVEDTGRYSCLAISPAGEDDKQFLVRVHGG